MCTDEQTIFLKKNTLFQYELVLTEEPMNHKDK